MAPADRLSPAIDRIQTLRDAFSPASQRFQSSAFRSLADAVFVYLKEIEQIMRQEIELSTPRPKEERPVARGKVLPFGKGI
ncbi:MAG TPA: hypothetical protein PLX02_12185 [Syntrophorhabdaceae bacterium]|nr:hypothetical protein [Syntrophorhabdaceae bacterium]HQM82371.1 hypothetical protein [Syntrophorhabdaceae bacterium]